METSVRPTYNRVDIITVDEENDFAEGSLPVKGYERTVPLANELGAFVLERGGKKFLSQDWHGEENTVHFGKWPVHCVAGTWGAEFRPNLDTSNATVLRKGMNDTEDGYSAWEAYDHLAISLQNHQKPLRGQRRALITTGVATDYCVGETAERALVDIKKWKKAGAVLDLYIPTDAVRGVDEAASDAMLEKLQKMGAILCSAADILTGKLFDVVPDRA